MLVKNPESTDMCSQKLLAEVNVLKNWILGDVLDNFTFYEQE